MTLIQSFGSAGASFGSYTDPKWATFVAGNSLSGSPYSGHGVLFVTVQTGNAWAAGFTGQLDGFEIELADGSIAKVNFEMVEPPPAATAVPATGNTGLIILILLLLSGAKMAGRAYTKSSGILIGMDASGTEADGPDSYSWMFFRSPLCRH